VIKEFDKNSLQKPASFNYTLEGKNPFTLFTADKRNPDR